MAKLSLLTLSLATLGAWALSTSPRSCGQVHAPFAIWSVSKEHRSEPAKPYEPYISINQLVYSTTGVSPFSFSLYTLD